MTIEGVELEPFHLTDDVAIYRGEALRVLRALPSESVDAVITDPPYSSGGAFRADRTKQTGVKYVQTGTINRRPDFEGDNRDQRGYLAWCGLWLSECLRVLKPGRVCAVFTDWRQLPTTTDALQAGGFVWRGIVVWDKGRGCRPMLGFSNQAEYVVWGTRGPIDLGHDVYLHGVQQATLRHSDRLHQTGKPTPLVEELVRVAPPGGVVLDPFFGSGTTGEAALRAGRKCIGIEFTETYANVAVERLQRVPLPAAPPDAAPFDAEQMALLDPEEQAA